MQKKKKKSDFSVNFTLTCARVKFKDIVIF